MLDQVLAYAASVCIIGIVVVITGGCFSRYVLNKPFVWTEELCTLLFIWLAFLAAGVATARKKHVSADFLSRLISDKAAKIISVISHVLILVFVVIMLVGGIDLIPRMNHTSVALGISKQIYYTPVVICAGFMLIVYFKELLELIVPFIFPESRSDMETLHEHQ
jgi:TRAP-type C4-dicarboxylate transport system permease small subunit